MHPAFTDGVLEVGVAGELSGKGAPDDRGFVGLSFHITPDLSSHETVYLRMTNGRLNVPPPPSHGSSGRSSTSPIPASISASRASASPAATRRAPTSRSAAGIACGWRSPVRGCVRSVDGTEVLVVEDLRFAGRRGPVGLFVGDGSRGYFRELRVLPA